MGAPAGSAAASGGETASSQMTAAAAQAGNGGSYADGVGVEESKSESEAVNKWLGCSVSDCDELLNGKAIEDDGEQLRFRKRKKIR